MIKLTIRCLAGILVLTFLAACARNNNKTAVDTHMHGTASDSSRYAERVNKGEISPDTMKGSPSRYAMALVDGCHVHISYRSPGVRNRIIWGGLVPYGEVWAAGAHHPTKVEINHPVTIGNVTLPAGSYALFLIPQKATTWTVILNKDHEQHNADRYDKGKDLLRIEIKPELLDTPVQRLTYKVLEDGTANGRMVFEWEKVRLTVPFIVKAP